MCRKEVVFSKVSIKLLTDILREGGMRGVRKNLVDYIAVDDKVRKDILDVKVQRGIFDRSEYFHEAE